MNRSLLALLPVALLTFGCPNEEDNPDSGTPVDTGLPKDTGVDSGTPSDSGTESDAGEDAGNVEDSGPEDGGAMDTGTSTSGEVVLRVTLLGQPPPLGILTVLFHDATGALILSTELDANGEARAEVGAGGMVSLVAPMGGGKGPDGLQIETIAGLEPPETLTIELANESMPGVNELSVTLPELYPGAEFHSVEFGCYDYTFQPGARTATFQPEPGCLAGATTVSLLAHARDAKYQTIAYAPLVGVPIAGPTVSATIAGPWLTQFASQSIALSNGLPSLPSVDVSVRLVQDSQIYSPVYGSTELINGLADFSFDVPMFGQAADVDINFTSLTAQRAEIITRSAVGASDNIDIANALLPFPSNLTVDSSADVARPTLSWMFDQPVLADLLVVIVYTDDNLSWTVALPPLATAFVVPELPASLGFTPHAGTTISLGVGTFETSVAESYRALRDRASTDTAQGLVEQYRFFTTEPIGATSRFSAVDPF